MGKEPKDAAYAGQPSVSRVDKVESALEKNQQVTGTVIYLRGQYSVALRGRELEWLGMWGPEPESLGLNSASSTP